MKRVLPILLLLLFISSVSAGRVASADIPIVIYDKKTDLLSIKVDRASLKEILARISIMSGLEILTVPEIEQVVTININDRPLEKGLKTMMKNLGLNYAMIYQKKKEQDDSEELLLVSIKIVPKDKMIANNLRLQPIIDVKGEAVIRAQSASVPIKKEEEATSVIYTGRPQILDYTKRRWQERLDTMSWEQRDEVEKRMKSVFDRIRAEREEDSLSEEEDARQEEEDRIEEQASLERLKELNPEFYELRMKQREEFLNNR